MLKIKMLFFNLTFCKIQNNLKSVFMIRIDLKKKRDDLYDKIKFSL